MSHKNIFCFWVLLLCLSSANAIVVNRVNGSANVVYVDFSITGSAVPLELVRSFNSITALSENSGWSGAFGWGWTSPIETTLTVTPERNVVLRDGGTGNNVTFRALKTDPKVLATFAEKLKKAYFEQQKKHKLTTAELARLELPEKMRQRLKTDPAFRAELSTRYGVENTVQTGETLVSSDYGYQTISFRNSQWIREKDGIYQFFDKDGRLIRQVDKNGVYFEYKYTGNNSLQVSEIYDQDKASSLKFTWQGDRVSEIVDNKGQKAKYQYDGVGNLTQVIDSHNQTFGYRYENKKFPHLLTRIDYISESKGSEKLYRELKYDDNGLVTFHREKDGTETQYTFGRASSNPENNFWTKSIKKTGNTTEELYEEFLLKARADGSKYLYKQDTKLGNNTTTTIFTACCGKPQQVVQNGEVTNYKYTEDGLLKEKIGPKEEVRFEYDPKWRKVTKVTQNGGFVSTYEYDSKGNLTKASNSRNEKVTLSYDRTGRITEMVDPEGKKITFKYGNLGKPTLITEKGIGTIRIDYDKQGRIVKTETVAKGNQDRQPSQTQSKEIIRRVMMGFQHLLNIIRPAGMSIASVANI